MNEETQSPIRARLKDMKCLAATAGERQRVLLAEIQFLIAEEQSKSAEKLEEQTKRLEKQMVELVGIAAEQKRLAEKLDGQTETIITLTRRLNRLTLWLVILTVALIFFETFHFVQSRKIEPSVVQFPQQIKQNTQEQGRGNAKP